MKDIIIKYPEIFQDYEGNPGRVNWSCPSGWVQVLDWLCGSIQSYTDNINKHNSHLFPVQQVMCTQVKEKFAGLRFYYTGGDDEIEGMVTMAEHICDNTCQECGSHEDVEMVGKGWITTLCKKCNTKKTDTLFDSGIPYQEVDIQF